MLIPGDSIPVGKIIRFLYKSDLIERASKFGIIAVGMKSMFERAKEMNFLQIENIDVLKIAQTPHCFCKPTLLCSRLVSHKREIKTAVETILKGLSIKLEYDKYESIMKAVQLLGTVLFSNVESNDFSKLEIKTQVILDLVAASKTNNARYVNF